VIPRVVKLRTAATILQQQREFCKSQEITFIQNSAELNISAPNSLQLILSVFVQPFMVEAASQSITYRLV